MKKEKWILHSERADFNALADKFHISPMLARLIVNRGANTEEKMEQYLYGDLERLHNPFLLKDMELAVDLILKEKEQGGSIAISSDFDCDGIFSGFVLKQGLKRVGMEADIFIPERVKEGYGINQRIVDEVKEKGFSMILTCDNGIAAVSEVQYAKDLGFTVIVTDHHEVQDEFPNADAVIDPKREDDTYPFKGLCGAGVAYKLILALYEKLGEPTEKISDLLQYVAIATVADIMDLVDENRVMVKHGLAILEHTDNVGLRAILDRQELIGKKLSGYHIGFVIGPCFNASGRLKTADMAIDLLEEKDEAKALKLAQELKDLNDERKSLTVAGAEQAYEIVEERLKNGIDKRVLLVLLPDCHESIVGIIAGRVKERYHKPTIVFTRTENGMIKGSARSIEAYNIFEELIKCKDLLAHFGGHKMAAGLSLEESNLEKLENRLNEGCTLTDEDMLPVVSIDIAMPIQYASEQFVKELELLEPLGKANEKPLFAEQHFRVIRAAKRGKDDVVLALTLENESKARGEAVMFNRTAEFEQFVEEEYGSDALELMYRGKGNIDIGVCYYPKINEYRGVRNVQLMVEHFCKINR